MHIGRVIKRFLFQICNEWCIGTPNAHTYTLSYRCPQKKLLSMCEGHFLICKMARKPYIYFLKMLSFTSGVLPWIKRAQCTDNQLALHPRRDRSASYTVNTDYHLLCMKHFHLAPKLPHSSGFHPTSFSFFFVHSCPFPHV